MGPPPPPTPPAPPAPVYDFPYDDDSDYEPERLDGRACEDPVTLEELQLEDVERVGFVRIITPNNNVSCYNIDTIRSLTTNPGGLFTYGIGYMKHPITRDIILIDQRFIEAWITRHHERRVQDYNMIPVADARSSAGPVSDSTSFNLLFPSTGEDSRFVNDNMTMTRIWNEEMSMIDSMHKTQNADSVIYVLRPVWG